MEFWIIGLVFVIYLLVMIRVQYGSIVETKKELKDSGQSHNEFYDKMSFEEQQMQFNLQGNLFNLPASLIAQLIYSLRHRAENTTK